MKPQAYAPVLVLCATLVGLVVVGMMAVMLLLPPPQPSSMAGSSPTTRTAQEGQSMPHRTTPAALQPRRLPVAGTDDCFVILMPDGTSYLETPTGRRELVDARTAAEPAAEDITRRLAQQLQTQRPPTRKTEPGRLIVLDEGVVDIPLDAVITFVAKDRLVAIGGDGTSTVYYADGRVEARERRTPRQPVLGGP